MLVIGEMELPLREIPLYLSPLTESARDKKKERACEDARSIVVQPGSSSDGLAGIDATTAALGALLAMLVLVGAALLGAVLTDLGAELAEGAGVRAIDRHDLDTGATNRRAFKATPGAVILRIFADHRCRTRQTVG
jgi:hypothetical protein